MRRAKQIKQAQNCDTAAERTPNLIVLRHASWRRGTSGNYAATFDISFVLQLKPSSLIGRDIFALGEFFLAFCSIV